MSSLSPISITAIVTTTIIIIIKMEKILIIMSLKNNSNNHKIKTNNSNNDNTQTIMNIIRATIRITPENKIMKMIAASDLFNGWMDGGGDD